MTKENGGGWRNWKSAITFGIVSTLIAGLLVGPWDWAREGFWDLVNSTPVAGEQSSDDQPEILDEFPLTISNSVASQQCKREGNTGYSWRNTRIAIDGKDFVPALYCQLQRGAVGWVEYNLSRKYTLVESAVGFSDEASSTEDRARFEIIGDGTVLATTTLGFGERSILTADVGGILRLRLQVTKLTDSGQSPEAGFGNPRASR